MTDITKDIKEEGPKLWQEIHSRCFLAGTTEAKRQVDLYLQQLQQAFICDDCKGHFGEYLRKYPPHKHKKKFSKEGSDLTYFHWSWKFHNTVNHRLGKPEFPFKDSYSYYKKLLTQEKTCNLTEEQKLVMVLRLIKEYRKKHPDN